jgi:hypothetical protein
MRMQEHSAESLAKLKLHFIGKISSLILEGVLNESLILQENALKNGGKSTNPAHRQGVVFFFTTMTIVTGKSLALLVKTYI